MASGAQLWLLDEPLNGLDTASGAAVEALVAAHCEAGGIALIASHQAFTLARLERLELAQFVPELV